MKQILSLPILFLLLNSCGPGKSTSSDEEEGRVLTDENPVYEGTDFVIAFGSCNKQDMPQPLWVPIVSHKPDVFIWGGDNIYADTADMKKLEADYEVQKKNKGYLELVNSTEILATWDDHDYGLNDGGENWEYKEESQQAFLDFINVPENDERRSREGIYHSKTFETEKGSIKIILLDTRYFRSDLTKSEEKNKRYEPDNEGTVLGDEQWAWLEQELKQSKADFNVIVSSIQFLAAEHGFETWGNFPAEVEKLKKLILSSNAENVVLLSGDRHLSEFSTTQISGLDYPVIDFTSSGLTHSYDKFSGEPNKFRTGEVVSDLSFGLLFFDFSNKKVTMQMRGVGNKLQQEYVQIYD